MAKNFVFNFPSAAESAAEKVLKSTKETGIAEDKISYQMRYVFGELTEAQKAYECEGHQRTAEELMDVLHAAETALRMLAATYVIDLDATRKRVIKGNQTKGYYQPGDIDNYITEGR